MVAQSYTGGCGLQPDDLNLMEFVSTQSLSIERKKAEDALRVSLRRPASEPGTAQPDCTGH
jgi:hypothetical protein